MQTRPVHPMLGSLWMASLLLCLHTACSEAGQGADGSLAVALEPEDLIVNGISAGDGSADIRDGWSVSFDTYLVTIGNIGLHFSTDDGVSARLPDVFTVDLTQLPAAGSSLWRSDSLRAGRWEFFYETPRASSRTKRHSSVSKEDHELMVDKGWTYLVRGTLQAMDGQSCPPAALAEPNGNEPNGNESGQNPCYDAKSIEFSIGLRAETGFGPCEVDGLSGVQIPSGGSQSAAISVHGDHMFFNGFPESSEGGVMRLAQWLADCDLDLDGEVESEELERISLDDLPELDERYQLGGSPITPLRTMADYVAAQLKTQGHFQGEGECALDDLARDDEQD